MASKSFQISVDFVGNVSDLQNKVRGLATDINKIGSTSVGSQIQKQFDSLSNTVTQLQTRLKQPITSQAQFDKIVSDLSKVEGGYDRLMESVNQLKSASNGQLLTLLSGKEQADIQKANNALKTYESTIEKAQASSKEFTAQQDRMAKAEGLKATATANIEKYSQELKEAEERARSLKQEIENLSADKGGLDKQRQSLSTQLSNERKKQGVTDNSKLTGDAKNLVQQYEQVKSKIAEINTRLGELQAKQRSANADAKNLGSAFDQATADAREAEVVIGQCTERLKQLGSGSTEQTKAAFQSLKNEAQALGISLEGIGDGSQDDIELLKQRFQEFESQGVEKARQKVETLSTTLQNRLGGSLGGLKTQMNGVTTEFNKFNEKLNASKQIETYFTNMVSGVNAIFLFRRALRDTVNTIKELDAAMTDTAVVTDFSVGDMWKKLPEYTAQANELSTSILSMYEATTLYYQQGLNSEQAMALGTETLKMARIAGLEAADATDKMTAALRGFNMELNEDSAQRVNDVYSKLASITASNVDEISTAMTKTASIADNAGMSFETTSAFLSQIIETTRESAETAGTAMKTIIARFQELKKDPSEIGEVDGEMIDANKIEGALRTIGVSLRDAEGQFRSLDEVFLEIAQKWDSLDVNTQRYIATMAAGSRQQSRFIAMMQDYDRTMELVTAANTSAGASQAQFEKTQESLEAKLNKLKNAWHEFTMGIANSSIVKGGVDLLTKLITVINKITGSLGDAGSAVSRLAIAFGTLKLAKFITPKIFSGLRGFFVAEGVKSGNMFTRGFNTAVAKIKTTAMFSGLTKFGSFTPIINASGALTGYASAANLANGAIAGLTPQLMALSTQYGLTETQILAAAAAHNAGVSADVAALAAKNGLTLAEIEEATATAAETTAESVNTTETSENTVATLANTYAQKGQTAAEQLGLGAKIKYNAQLLFGNAQTRLAAAEKLGLITTTTAEAAATEGATGAQIGYNSALLACPIGWIIAGIAALVGVIALIDATTESAAEETKSWKKTLEGATDAASEAKGAYQEVFDVRNEYDETQKALEELTQGTQEWSNALFEANQQVLELLATYPLLANYISRGSEGQLVIGSEGWDLLIQQLQWQNSNANAMMLGNQTWLNSKQYSQNKEDAVLTLNQVTVKGSQQNYSDVEDSQKMYALDRLENMYLNNPEAFVAKKMSANEVDEYLKSQGIERQVGQFLEDYGGEFYRDLMEHSGYKTTDTNWENNYTGTTYSQLLEEVDNGELEIYSFDQEMLALADELGLTAIELVEMREQLGPYTAEQRQLQAQISSTLKSMINLDEEYAQSKYAASASNIIGDAAAENYYEDLEATSDELWKASKKQSNQGIVDIGNELKATGKDLTGLITATEGSKKYYQQVYQVLTGQVANKDWNRNELANQIAAAYNNEQRSNAAEEIISRMEALEAKDSNTAELLNAIMNKSAEGLDMNELLQLEGMELTAESVAAHLGYEDIVEIDENGI